MDDSSNPLRSVDPTAAYLSPAMTAHVARNIVEEGIGPMLADMQYVKDMLRRMLGDDDDSDIPVALRYKGSLREIKEAQIQNHQEGIQAFADIHKELVEATDDRTQIKESQVAIEARVAALEIAELEKIKQQHRTRRFFKRIWKELTQKDDAFSVAIFKITALLAAPVTIGIGAWKLLVIIVHFIVRVAKSLT